MKKNTFCLFLAAVALSLSSCNRNDDGLYIVAFEGSLDDPTLSDLQSLYDGGYNYIDGSVVLDSLSGLEHLLYLSNVRTIAGDLVIRDNPDLETLDGLHRLQSVTGDLILSGNPALVQVSYVPFVRHVGGDLVIAGNPELFLAEMPSLKRVEGDLVIDGNASLAESLHFTALETVAGHLLILRSTFIDMRAFHALQEVGGIVEVSGTALRGLTGLESLRLAGGGLVITGNKKLCDLCGIKGLLEANGAGDDVTISGNGYNPSVQAIMDGDCSQ